MTFFHCLHLDVYQLIFDYLSQQDLLNFLLINRTFYQQIMKYIGSAKLYKIENNIGLEDYGRLNLIISIKMNTITKPEWNWGMNGACRGGHIQLVELLIKKGANYNTSSAIYFASVGGNIEIVKLLINKGANDFNWGLAGACENDNIEIAKLMIENGAKDFDWVLRCACNTGRIESAKMMIEYGANDWNGGLYWACASYQKNTVKLMIEKGADRCYRCRKTIEEHLNIDKNDSQ